MEQRYTVFFDDDGFQGNEPEQGAFTGLSLQAMVDECAKRPHWGAMVAWAPESIYGYGGNKSAKALIAESIAAGRTIDLIDGKYVARGVNERGEPIESSDGDDATWKAFSDVWDRHVAEIAERNRALFGLVKPTAAISKTPTLDKLENTRDPKRAPLPYFTERASSDRFPGFTVKSSTTEQPRERVFCDSPDMLPASHQVSPGFGSAALVVKG